MKVTVCASFLMAAVAFPAFAQQPAPGMAMHGSADAAGSPSAQAFKAANDKMMQGMGAHHQGAVDMARVEQQYGKDPEMRRLAAAIIAAQDKEIAQMKAWQAKHK
jgi:uncharacterized protein (DUF305 family)